MSTFTIAIHGGAGTIDPTDMSAELETAYRDGLKAALDAGYSLLEKGEAAIEAVRVAAMILEDNILFNAGLGSVFTNTGEHEMDAAIMDGATLNAGAVAAAKNIRNPIELAAEIMLNSNHVFLCGEGAVQFARKQGIRIEPNDYFFSEFRYNQWKSISGSDEFILDHSKVKHINPDKKFGTIGVVCCDRHGNIAAATSTGGMTNKRFGRIGDSPVIGSGTYANNKTCAISCTGHGEPFIRAVAAYDVSCLMEYKGLSLHEAMNVVVNEKLAQLGGEGGMIGVDAKGNAALLFNSDGMYRGVRDSTGRREVAIYK